MGKPSRSREQAFEQGPRKGTGQVGQGTAVGTGQEPLLALGPFALSRCLAAWRPGGLRTEDTEQIMTSVQMRPKEKAQG